MFCRSCICSPRQEFEVVLQQPQNNLVLLCYIGRTSLSAFASQFTTETSLWAYPCRADAIVHRQQGCSEYAAGGGLSVCLYSRQPLLAFIYTILGVGPQVVKSESGSKHNFLQHSQEISSLVWVCSIQIKAQLQSLSSNQNFLKALGSGAIVLF